jgi:hypothetical protein
LLKKKTNPQSRIEWALRHKNEIGLDLSFNRRGYLKGIYADTSRVIVATKPAQVGFTTFGLVDTFHALMELRVPLGVALYYPNTNYAAEFAKTKLDGFIRCNADIADFCEGEDEEKNTDAKSLKRFSGGSCLFVRGLYGLAIRSLSADKLVFDEISGLGTGQVFEDIQPNLTERLTASLEPSEVYMSTPMDEGMDIDLIYHDDECDQKKWMVKCRRCNESFVLADHWPECISSYKGDYNRVCYKCGGILSDEDVDAGQWVAQNSIGKAYSSGYSISQLDAPFITAYDIHCKHRKMKDAPFNRLVLGRAFTAQEDKLTIEEILKNIGSVGYDASEKTVIGVDPGRDNHYYVILTFNPPHRLVKFGVMNYFDNLISLAQQFNALRVVMDIGAETNMVRDMKEKLKIGYSNAYIETRMPIKCDDARREIAGSRTEMLDIMVTMIKSGAIVMPEREVMEQKIGDATFLQQMTKLKKLRLVGPTGKAVVKWSVGNPSHLFHCMAYACMGIQSTRGYETPFSWVERDYMEEVQEEDAVLI